MIAADAFELQANLRQTVIHIRQKEVALFTDQFGVLASASTFLGTLAFGGLLMSINFLDRGAGSHEYCSDLIGCDTRETHGIIFNNETAIHVFYLLVASGVAFNFAVVFVSVYCLILGPELAIRGAEREQKRAIKGMYEERTVALKLFWVGCGFIVLSGGALGWLKYPESAAVTMTAVFLFLFLGSMYYVKYRLTPLFVYHDAEGLDCTHLVVDDQDDVDVADTNPSRGRHELASDDADGLFSVRRNDATFFSLGKKKKKKKTPVVPSSATRRSFFGDRRSGGTASSASLLDKATRGRPSRWERVVRDAWRPQFRQKGEPSKDAHASQPYATSKASPVVVDGERRFGLLAEGKLRVFELDGSLLRSLDLAAGGWTVDLYARGEAFALRRKTEAIVIAGADVDDTQQWIRAVAANLGSFSVSSRASKNSTGRPGLDADDGQDFSDGGDDDDDAVEEAKSNQRRSSLSSGRSSSSGPRRGRGVQWRLTGGD